METIYLFSLNDICKPEYVKFNYEKVFREEINVEKITSDEIGPNVIIIFKIEKETESFKVGLYVDMFYNRERKFFYHSPKDIPIGWFLELAFTEFSKRTRKYGVPYHLYRKYRRTYFIN